MARQAQQRRGGGSAPRQVARVAEQPTENQRASMRDKANRIIAAVKQQAAQIESFLPSNISIEMFIATLTMALRHNPDILNCTVASIVQACCKAAYDGLALDGREAALVPNNVKVSKGREPDRYEKQARYNPMVYGLIKQMVKSGLVTDAHATLVYEGEPYRVIRGTEQRIEHEEIPEKRGPSKKIRAVYGVAWLTSGQIKFETMSAEDVAAVRATAATDFVWGKNEGEMTRKTVIRRLRKSVAGGQEIRDAEQAVLYPQYQADAPRLPAPAKPDRRDYQERPAELEHQNEVTVDVFGDFDSAAEHVFADGGQDQAEERGGAQRRTEPKTETKPDPKGKSDSGKQSDAATDDNRQGARASTGDAASISEGPVIDNQDPAPAYPPPKKAPTNEADWRLYVDGLKTVLAELPNIDALNVERRAHQPFLDQAPAAIRDELTIAFQDAVTDLVGAG